MRKLCCLVPIIFFGFNSIAQTITPAGTVNICTGQTQDFTVTGSPAPASFQWQFNDADISGATAATFKASAPGKYRVIINGGRKEGDTLGPVELKVNPNPVAGFTSSPSDQCANIPVSFTNTSTGSASYLWKFGDPLSKKNDSSKAANPLHEFMGARGIGNQPFQVKLIAKSAAGCVDSITKTVTVTKGPDGTLGGTGIGTFDGDTYFSICGNYTSGDFTFSNQSTTIATNTGYRIVWGDGSPDFVSTTFTSTVQHTYPVGTNKLLFITSGQNGCIDTTAYFVFVGTNPAVGLGNPGNTAICSGEALTFPISGINNNPPGTIYTVSFNDGTAPDVYVHPNVPSSVNHQFKITSCNTYSSTGTTTYPNSFYASIRASNPCNSSEAIVVPIYVSEKPNASFTVLPKDTICVNNILKLQNTSKASSVNADRCKDGNIIWSVIPSTGWTIKSGSLGGDFGSPNPDVWLTGSNLLELNFSQPGTYIIKLKTGNAFCGTNETTRTICVNPAPSASYTIDKNSGCAPMIVSTAMTDNTPTCGKNRFVWTVDYTAAPGCGTLSGNYTYLDETDSSSAQPKFQFNDPGVYKISMVMISPGGTCTTPMITKTVTVKGKPIVAISNLPAALCQYLQISPAATASCFTDASTIYSWTFPGGIPSTSSLLDPGKIAFDTAGNYTIVLSATNECGITTAASPVTIQPTPVIAPLADTTVCPGATVGPVSFTSNPSGAAFSWTNSNTSIGLGAGGNSNSIPAFTAINNSGATITSIVTVTGKLGTCSSTENFKITVGARPELPGVQNIAYCKGDVAQPLTAAPAGTNTLLWYPSATGGTGSTTAPIPATNITGVFTYYVSQVSAGTQCEGLRVPINVTVHAIPAIASFTSINPSLCATATGSITLSGLEPNKTYEVYYSKDGLPAALTLQANASGTLTLSNLRSGTYSNIYVKADGCPSNIAGPIVLNDPNPPPAPVASANSPLCYGSNLQLNASVVIPGTFTYKWTGPNGFSSTQPNTGIANATATASGTYYVTATQNNCTSPASSVQVVINPLPAPPATSPVAYCIDAPAIPLNASGNNLLWYNVPSGGTGSNVAPTPPTSAPGTIDYYVTQTDNNGCESNRSLLNVVIHPNAKALFTPPVSIYCPPFQITPEAVGLHEYPAQNSQYTWYINGVFAGNGVLFPGYTIPLANDSVDIKLVATSSHGCQPDSMSHKFFTYKLPNPSFKVDKTDGCGPLSVLITNTTEDIGLYWYEWDFGNGQTSTAVQPGNIIFLPNPSYRDTTYYVKLKMLSVCDTLVVQKGIHVKSRPKALFTPDHTTGCSPMKVTFKNTSRGIGNTYYWDFGDGHSDVTNTLEDVQHTFFTSVVDTFFVRLIVVNECGNDTLQYAVITAPNTIKLNFAMNGPDHSGCIPHTVAFINNSSGASTFQWDFGDGNFLSTSKNIDTVYHTYLAAGNFRVSLRAQNNCSDTTAFDNITVYPKPKAAFTATGNRVCIGDVISFSNQSELATSYQWEFGDGATSVLENPVHKFVVPGIYSVKLKVFKSNAPGSICIDSTVQQMQVVNSLPGTFSMSDSVADCAPLTVRFFNQTLPSVTALWDFGDGTSAAGDNATHTYNYSGTYNVTLTVTVSGGCRYITTKTVTVRGPSGKLNYSGGYYCSPEKVRLEVIATNTTSFQWDFGDGTTLTTTEPVVYHSYADAGNYIPSVSLKGTTSCEYFIKGIDTIRIDKIEAGYTILQQKTCGNTQVTFRDTSHVFAGKRVVKWDFGDGSIAIGGTVVHDFKSTGDYVVEMIVESNSGCADTVRNTINFHVNNKPVISLEADASACANLPVVFSGNVQSPDSLSMLQWDISNGAKATGARFNYVFANPGTYQIRFIAGTVYGCYDTAYHTIVVKPSPVVKAGPDVTICKGNSVQLNASGAIQYQWSPLQWLSCTTCANPVVAPEISTPYVVAGFNNVGCPDYDTVNVTVIQPFRLGTSGNDSICIGQSASLMVSGAATYKWTPSTSLSSTTISNPIANPSVTTTYRVIGYDGHNCFNDTAFLVVAVGQYPTIELGPDQIFSTGTLLPLNSVVTNGPVRKWTWSPAADLDCAGCAIPVAHIKKDITYTVEIKSAYGCSASDSIHIKVFCESAQVFVPNAFSPDGDGVNDVLMVRAKGIAMVKSFRVFNRWGQIVFERNNFQPNELTYGWDGKVGGRPEPPGVYVYTAEVLCENGVPYTYKGNTTILK